MRGAREAGRGSQTPKLAQGYASWRFSNAPAKRQGAFVTSRELLCEGSVNADGRGSGWVRREPAPRTHLPAPLSIAGYAQRALAYRR
jgi:hypothetical protein